MPDLHKLARLAMLIFICLSVAPSSWAQRHVVKKRLSKQCLKAVLKTFYLIKFWSQFGPISVPKLTKKMFFCDFLCFRKPASSKKPSTKGASSKRTSGKDSESSKKSRESEKSRKSEKGSSLRFVQTPSDIE